MRVVKRHEYTTWYDEIPYHLIKDEKEMKNVTEGVNIEKIVIMRKSTDPISFQNILWFAVPNTLTRPDGLPFSHIDNGFITSHFFYVVDLSVATLPK